MASLSNINGLFDVHSTGAILFSTSHGTSGQILRSNGNAAPTWVAASTVIGGPYLPLTGGTLSGPLSGTSLTLSGTLSGTTAIFNTEVAIGGATITSRKLAIYNTNAANEIEFIGTEYTNIYSQTNSTMAVEVTGTGVLRLATTGGNLTIANGGNATFSGTVNATGYSGPGQGLDNLLSLSTYATTPASTGVLIATNIITNNYAFIFGTIKLQRFHVAEKQTIEFSAMALNTGVIQSYQATSDVAITFKIFNYNGYWYLHFPMPAYYTTATAFINTGEGYQGQTKGFNEVSSISMNAVPSSGVTNSVDVVSNVYLTTGTSSPWLKNGNDIYNSNSGNVGINETNPGSKLQINTSDERGTMLNSTVADKLIYSQINANSSTASTITGAAAIELVGQANASGHGRHAWIGAEGTSNTTFETKLKFKLRGETASGYDWAGSAEAPTIMTLEGSGNVGIGTNSPSAKLDIKAAGSTTGLTFRTTDASGNENFFIQDGGRTGVRYYPFTVGQASGTSAASGARFQVATTAGDFVVLNDGKTGIGTTSPSKKLEVAGSYKLGTNAYIQYDAGYPYTISILNTAGVGNLIFNAGAGSSGYESKIELQGSNTAGAAGITLSTGSSPRMVVTADGKVGIGTEVPNAQLHINNDTSNSYSKLILEGANRGGIIDMYNATYPVSRILTDQSGNIFFSTSGAFASTSLSTRFTMLTNGNLGVGTTTPYNRLHSSGVLGIGTANQTPGLTSTMSGGGGGAQYPGGSIYIVQGYAGSMSSGDTFTFIYEATVWKAWSAEFVFTSTAGMSRGAEGGYNNNGAGHSSEMGTNALGCTAVTTNVGQHVKIVFTFTNPGTHPMAKITYSQSGGDGVPRADRVNINWNT